MEVKGEAGDYISIATQNTVTTGMTSALRWTASRAILMSFIIVRDKVTRQCPHWDWPQLFKRKLRRAEVDSNLGPSAYQPNALLLGQTGSQTGSESIHSLPPDQPQGPRVCTSNLSDWSFRRCLFLHVPNTKNTSTTTTIVLIQCSSFSYQ